MKPDLSSAIHLLHRAPFGALATQASQLPGYPFATALPFVTDENHCPVFLLSALAEHTKNLLADCRASLLVTDPEDANVLEMPRMTLVGDAQRFEASTELQARYIRYQPDAAQYLELGDFSFFRLMPQRTRYIGGFARMGWLEQDAWEQGRTLALQEEAGLIRDCATAMPAGVQLLGLDCYGIDLLYHAKRTRHAFTEPQEATGICAEVARLLEGMPRSAR